MNLITSAGGPKMIKRLTRHGRNLAIVIDRGLLDQLEIDRETPLSVTTDGTSLVITPVRDVARRRRFEEALAEGNRRYGRALKRFAE